MSARIALPEICAPHFGPTSVTLTSRRIDVERLGDRVDGLLLHRRSQVLGLDEEPAVADLLDRRLVHTGVLERVADVVDGGVGVSDDATWKAVPPRNSRPALILRIPSEARLTTTTTPEMRNHVLRAADEVVVRAASAQPSHHEPPPPAAAAASRTPIARARGHPSASAR